MKQILMVTLVSILLLSDSCDTKRHYVFATYSILNHSDHKIELLIFKSDKVIDTILLPTYGSDTVYKSRRVGIALDPPPFLSNSVKVTYDDSISIVHIRSADQDASRSILMRESWIGGNIGGKDYAWEYLFSNDDYEEAVLLQ